jgi:hypothetical protein
MRTGSWPQLARLTVTVAWERVRCFLRCRIRALRKAATVAGKQRATDGAKILISMRSMFERRQIIYVTFLRPA